MNTEIVIRYVILSWVVAAVKQLVSDEIQFRFNPAKNQLVIVVPSDQSYDYSRLGGREDVDYYFEQFLIG